MQMNMLIRHINESRGFLVGTIDPLVDDLPLLVERIQELGVGGDATSVHYQFVADERGGGLEFIYSDE
jgi:hypothetical protein